MVKVQWFGHASFRLDIGGKTVLVDPFITENPLSPVKSIDELGKVDVIVITHDHPDHFGDSVEIAKKFNSKIVAIFETASKTRVEGAPECIGMNIGGTVKIDDLSITLTPAFHSMSSNPSGVVASDGKMAIYHAGDTSLFSDMKFIRKLYKPTIALLPIGGFYTMGPREAAIATSLIKPKIVIPMHYNTWDVIRQEPEQFKRELRKVKVGRVKVVILKPGEVFEI